MKKVIFILAFFLAVFALSAADNERNLEYYKNGSVKSKVIKHENFSEVVKFYESGTVEETEFYDLDKNRTGCWTRYYENGSIMATATFKNDKKDGDWKSYDSNGKLYIYIKYIKGKKQTVCMITADKELAVK